MNHRLTSLWDGVRTSFWFFPGAMVAGGGVGLSLLTVWIDQHLQADWLSGNGWVWSGNPEGARVMLSTIAGSMITVAGVVFSITMVVLALAANQFGPRTLRNFMRDAGNQFVLGTFLTTFVYCLLVLRTVRGQDDSEFVPQVSITTAILLAMLSVGVLIYFVHHVSSSIQAGEIVAATARELHECMDRVWPADEREAAPQGPPDDREGSGMEVMSADTGYVQSVDEKALVKLASQHDLILEVRGLPGNFVYEGTALARVRAGSALPDDLEPKIRRAFVLGDVRTPVQDLEYCVHRLAEVAVRSLSPGINDPYTALLSLDQVGAAMSRLLRRPAPPAWLEEEKGRARVLAPRPDFPRLAGAAWHQVRQYGAGNVSVVIRLIEIIRGLAPCVRRAADFEVLRDHLARIEHDASRQIHNPWDLETVRQLLSQARQEMG